MKRKLCSLTEIYSRTKEIVPSPSPSFSPVSTSAISPAPSQEAYSPVDYSIVFQDSCPTLSPIVKVPEPVTQGVELYEQVVQPLPEPFNVSISHPILNSILDPLWDSISQKLFHILTNGELWIPQGTAARFLLDLGKKWQLEEVVDIHVASMFEKTPVSVLQHVDLLLSDFSGNFYFLEWILDSIL